MTISLEKDSMISQLMAVKLGKEKLKANDSKSSWTVWTAALKKLAQARLYGLIVNNDFDALKLQEAAKRLKKRMAKSALPAQRNVRVGILLRALYLVVEAAAKNGEVKGRLLVAYARNSEFRLQYIGEKAKSFERSEANDKDRLSKGWPASVVEIQDDDGEEEAADAGRGEAAGASHKKKKKKTAAGVSSSASGSTDTTTGTTVTGGAGESGGAAWAPIRARFFEYLTDEKSKGHMTGTEVEAAKEMWADVPTTMPRAEEVWELIAHTSWTGQRSMHSTLTRYRGAVNDVLVSIMDARFYQQVETNLRHVLPEEDDEAKGAESEGEDDRREISGVWLETSDRRKHAGIGATAPRLVINEVNRVLLTGEKSSVLLIELKKKMDALMWDLGDFAGWYLEMVEVGRQMQTIMDRAKEADEEKRKKAKGGETLGSQEKALQTRLGYDAVDEYVLALMRKGVKYWAQKSVLYNELLYTHFMSKEDEGLKSIKHREAKRLVAACDTNATVDQGFDMKRLSAEAKVHPSNRGKTKKKTPGGGGGWRSPRRERANNVEDASDWKAGDIVNNGEATRNIIPWLNQFVDADGRKPCLSALRVDGCQKGPECEHSHSDHVKEKIKAMNGGKLLKPRRKGGGRYRWASPRGRANGGKKNGGGAPQPAKKNAICKFWKRGSCTKGSKCNYKHGDGSQQKKEKQWQPTKKELAQMMKQTVDMLMKKQGKASKSKRKRKKTQLEDAMNIEEGDDDDGSDGYEPPAWTPEREEAAKQLLLRQERKRWRLSQDL